MNFIEKLIKGERKEPPFDVVQSFTSSFPEAVNIDWYEEGDRYEAVFYLNSIEHIALFDSEANLLQYKMSLQEQNLPGLILQKAYEKGELMNAVLINSGNNIRYECILRDKDLKRWLLLYDDSGNVLNDSLL